jgi:hypothetical protein
VPSAGLFGSGVLEVAIGLIFLYFVLSTVASSVNELIATILKWRANNLEWALGNLINDPTLLRQVVEHPLMRSMGQNASATRGQQPTTPADLLAKARLEGRPSYIPSRTFALAVMHSLANPRADVVSVGTPGDGSIDIVRIRQTAAALLNADQPAQPGGDAEVRLAQSKRLTGEVVQALLEECRDPQAAAQALSTAKQRLVDGLQHSASTNPEQLRLSLDAAFHLDDIRALVAKLPDSERDWATSIIDAAAREVDVAAYRIDNLRTSIETWFDHAMDRAAGVYKRRALLALATIALVLTVVSGADSVQFVTRLYVDSVVRTQLAQQAGQAAPVLDITKAVQSLEPYVTLFGYADIPGLGAPGFAGWLLLKIAGEAVTVFAIMLGAPFWFDVLGKVANVRGSGPKPQSAAKG